MIGKELVAASTVPLVLSALTDGESYGYELIQRVRELSGGKIEWKDADKIQKVITEEIPEKVAADKAYQNAKKNPDKQNARIEHDKALERVMIDLLSDHTELFKQFSDNPSFKKWLAETIFSMTYQPEVAK